VGSFEDSYLERPDAGRRAFERPEVSVVVPFFNEEGALVGLLEEIHGAFARASIAAYEIVAVNDGSRDRTTELLELAAGAVARVRHCHSQVNRGQAAALYFGLRKARAAAVVTLDGDGQNDPADIPALLRLLLRADMVVGYRFPRHDTWTRRAISRTANRVRGRILRDGVRDSGCALKAMRREVVDSLLPIRTIYSFIPALAVAAGFQVIETPVRHRPRSTGRSSYGLVQFGLKPAWDLLGMWWYLSRRIR
jgi:dolichol-phosphate mannosyltransferase